MLRTPESGGEGTTRRAPVRPAAGQRWRIALLLAMAGAAPGSLVAADTAVQVRVATGMLQGHAHAGTARYLGIPYAAPPTGDLRWRVPRPPAAWEGIRKAQHFADPCPQIGNFYASDDAADFGDVFGSEDCLYLNVWVPDGAQPPRPVVVFIHGGSGVAGAASFPAYEASRLARGLGAVIVTINYRLGFFGHIHSAALRTGDPLDDSGSFGLLDQMRALEWVQENIAGFGGDPDDITVMGHSAGAIDIWSLIRSPLARGLFHKAIILSGIPLSADREELTERTNTFLHALVSARDGGNEVGARRQLETFSNDELRTYLYSRTTAEIVDAGQGLRNLPHGRDGTVLPQVDAGQTVPLHNPVPTLMGNVANEASVLLIRRYSGLSDHELWERINQPPRTGLGRRDFFGWFDDLRFRVACALFNRGAKKRLSQAADRLATEDVPVYRYRFQWAELPPPWDRVFGAYHGLDLHVIFGDFRSDVPNFSRFAWQPETRATVERLHRDMVAGIRAFIEAGDPGAAPGAIDWADWRQRQAVARIE